MAGPTVQTQRMNILTLSWENVTLRHAGAGATMLVRMAADAYKPDFSVMVVLTVTMVKTSKPNIVTVEKNKCFLAKKGDASRDTQFARLWKEEHICAILETKPAQVQTWTHRCVAANALWPTQAPQTPSEDHVLTVPGASASFDGAMERKTATMAATRKNVPCCPRSTSGTH